MEEFSEVRPDASEPGRWKPVKEARHRSAYGVISFARESSADDESLRFSRLLRMRIVGGNLTHVVGPPSAPPPRMRARTTTQMIPRAELEELARSQPAKLLELIRGGTLAAATLTYAAEFAGRIRAPGVVPALLTLLDHPSAVVREGAIYGLGRQDLDAAARERLYAVALRDPNADIREAAEDVLGER